MNFVLKINIFHICRTNSESIHYRDGGPHQETAVSNHNGQFLIVSNNIFIIFFSSSSSYMVAAFLCC